MLSRYARLHGRSADQTASEAARFGVDALSFVLTDRGLREELSRPMGYLLRLDPDAVAVIAKELSRSRRIVAVGDFTVLELLRRGVMPDIAVVDFRIMRRELARQAADEVRRAYKGARLLRVRNPAGTLNPELLRVAEKLMGLADRCLVLVEGEEDLVALAFMMSQDERHVVLYGQPGEGAVVVVGSVPEASVFEQFLLRFDRLISSSSR